MATWAIALSPSGRLGGGTKPNTTISQLCWVSLRFTQPTWLGFWGVVENQAIALYLTAVGFHCVSPNLLMLGFTQPTWLGFWEVREN